MLGFAIAEAHAAARRSVSRGCVPGLGMAQREFLRLLLLAPGVTLDRVASRLALGNQAALDACRRLRARGLVEGGGRGGTWRGPLQLTCEGRTAAERIDREVRDVELRLRARFSTSEREHLLTLLARLRDRR